MLLRERDDWSQVASEWLATGEVGVADADGLSELLRDLSDFAREATAAGKRVYCWSSL
jgi:hypothetical protein